MFKVNFEHVIADWGSSLLLLSEALTPRFVFPEKFFLCIAPCCSWIITWWFSKFYDSSEP